jgi:malate synthase
VPVTTGVELRAPVEGRGEEILTPEAFEFVAGLQRRFNATRDGRRGEARAVFEEVALGEQFAEFLTVPAYDYLD